MVRVFLLCRRSGGYLPDVLHLFFLVVAAEKMVAIDKNQGYLARPLGGGLVVALHRGARALHGPPCRFSLAL